MFLLFHCKTCYSILQPMCFDFSEVGTRQIDHLMIPNCLDWRWGTWEHLCPNWMKRKRAADNHFRNSSVNYYYYLWAFVVGKVTIMSGSCVLNPRSPSQLCVEAPSRRASVWVVEFSIKKVFSFGCSSETKAIPL